MDAGSRAICTNILHEVVAAGNLAVGTVEYGNQKTTADLLHFRKSFALPATLDVSCSYDLSSQTPFESN